MDVLALSGATVDHLPVLAVFAVLGVLVVALLSRALRLAFAGWLAAVCFVPVWAGITVKVSLEPHVLASLGLVVCLLVSFVGGRGRGPTAGRVTWGDGLFVAFVVTSLVPVLVGRTTFSDLFVLLVQWTAAFLAGRLIGYRVPLSWVYGAVAVAFSVVSVLALVEFLTHWNPFVLVPGSDSLHAVWSPIQDRGGRARAEGAFGHSIALGACLAMAVPITVASPFRTWLRMGMVVLMLGASVVTFSRIGLVTAVLGVALAVVFLRSGLSSRVRAAVVGGLVVVAVGSASLVSQVFTAAGAEATDSAGYRLALLDLIPDLVPFGYSSGAYRQATGQLVLANIPTSDGILQSIDNALLLLGLTYGWVPMVAVLAGLLAAVGCVLARWVTAPTIALVAQIPALATVALITQYSTVTWFVAGLAVFSQSLLRAPNSPAQIGDAAPPSSLKSAESSPEMVDDAPMTPLPALP